MKVRVVLAMAIVVIALGGLAVLIVLLNGPTAPPATVAAPVPAPPPTAPAPERHAEAPKAAAPEPKARPATPPPAVTPVEAAPATGTLTITSDVPDASVFIDRVYLGSTPVTAKDLTPGTHRLNSSATGYDGIAEDITVEAGTHELTVSFKTIRLDAKLEVLHKHGVGSCRGTLVATPQGLTYDTTNAEDAFRVALTDLETFEVDYLNKNLRLKIRKGRTFNFTDPDGQADRLFVFQRDVDKARQRLISGK